MEKDLLLNDELVCPFCKAYFTYEPTDDEIICPICNNKISEDDLEDVHGAITAGVNHETLQTENH